MPIGKKSDPEGSIVSPVEFYPGSNGEAPPEPPTRAQIESYAVWRRIIEDKHKRLGMTRRELAESACGMAAALLVMNQAACSDNAGSAHGEGADAATGGSGGGADGRAGAGSASAPDAAEARDVTPDMTEDMAAARERLSGDELIIDVHTHPPNGTLLEPWAPKSPQQEALDYIKLMYVQSDTALAIITGWPNARALNEANVKANATLQELVDRLGGNRYLFHANANPDLAGEPEYIEKLAGAYKNIAAWKLYPAEQGTMRLHQRTSFLERVQKTGIKIVAAHRGLHNDDAYADPGSPEDIVRAALMFPDIKFLVYHSGFENTADERKPYEDKGAQTKGVDRFVKAMIWAQGQNGGKPLTNVYADIGSTWARIMGDGLAAPHVMGKLLRYVGVDNVLWGTDSFNSGLFPTPQIAAMRLLQIPTAMQTAQGYPAITAEVRRKLFGLNACAVYGLDPQAVRYRIKDDDVAKLKMAWQADPRSVPMPHPRRYRGPRTRREFLTWQAFEKKAWG